MVNANCNVNNGDRISDLGVVILWLIVLLSTVVFLGPKLNSEFAFEDDILIQEYIFKGSPLIKTLIADIQKDWTLGRTRIVYWLVQRISTQVIGSNPFVWHLLSIVNFLITIGLFYRFLIFLTDDKYASIIGSTSAFLISHLLITYIRLSPAEILANTFLLSAILVKIKRNHYLVSSLLLLAAFLCKETYVFFFPVLLLTTDLSQSYKKIVTSKTAIQVVLTGIVCGLMLLFLYLRAGSNSYGMTSFENDRLSTITTIISEISSNILFVVALPIALIAAFRDKVVRNQLILLILLAVLQFGIYTYRSVILAHYYYPAAFSFGIITAIGLSTLFKLLPSNYVLVTSISLLLLSNTVNRFGPYRSAYYAAETQVLVNMIDKIFETEGISSLVVVHAKEYSVNRGATIQGLLNINGKSVKISDVLIDTLTTIPDCDAIVFSRTEEQFPDMYQKVFDNSKYRPQKLVAEEGYFHIRSMSWKKAKSSTVVLLP